MRSSLSASEAATRILERVHGLALAEHQHDSQASNLQQLRGWIADLPADGWWPEINAADRSRNAWQPLSHMQRLQSIAILSGPAGPLANDAAATAALERGLEAWQRMRPRSLNWWFNELGVPLATVQILASRRDLSSELRSTMQDWLGKPLDEGEYADTFTGQNLAWRARIALLAAADSGDLATLERALAAITSTITLSGGEGLQMDGSWHQHGAQFMTGSYGRGWVIDMARWQVVLQDTPWALSPAQGELIDRAALDGLAWTLRGGRIDPAALGRTVSRERAHHILYPLAVLAHAVAKLAGPRADEWQQLAAACSGEDDAGSARSGAKHFWRSDASFLHRPGFSVGILAATTRTLRVESLNEEHLLGALHADGATWIRQRGDEFARLSPLLPWALLPGTVAAEGSDLRPPGITVPAESTFGAGIADGPTLVHGWDLRRDALLGQQAWFGLEQGLVALVCGVTHPSAVVHISGPIMPRVGAVSIDGKELAERYLLQAGQAMIHDGLAWLALEGEWEATRPTLGGSWRRINAGENAQKLAMEALGLRRSLGQAPQNGSGAWALLDLEDGAVPTLSFRVLANTPDVQALQDSDGSVLAVFRSAAEIGGLSASGPAVIIARPDGLLIAADPLTTRQGRKITVQWQGQLHSIAFPGGPHSAQPIAAPSTKRT